MKCINLLIVLAVAGTGSLAAVLADSPASTTPAAPASITAVPAVPAVANGQHAFRHAMRARIIRSLHLTGTQRMQAIAIRERTAAKVKVISADAALTQELRNAKVAATREEGQRQFREVLTDQQREKLFQARRLLVQLRRLLQQ